MQWTVFFSPYVRWAGVVLAVVFLSSALLIPARAGGSVVGTGTPESCTDAAFQAAVAGGGTVTFNCGPNPHTILVTTAVINHEVTIDGGDDSQLITLSGEMLRQIFLVQAQGNLTVRSLGIVQAESGSGGAIRSAGTVMLDDVTIRSSEAQNGSGGAIYNDGGTLTVTRSRLLFNHADQDGGAIFNAGGTVTVEQSLLLGNEADDEGGGIYNAAASQLTLTNNTFTSNFGSNRAGGLYNNGTATLLNNTLHLNRSDIGGALYNAGETTVKNTILSGSISEDGSFNSLNCDGPSVLSEGNNLVSDGTCVSSGNATDQRNTDPLLGTLQNNGGPTLSFLPLAGSPAINTGANNGCPATDQRGYLRPVGAACDVGAIEVGAVAPPVNYPVYLPLVQTGN